MDWNTLGSFGCGLFFGYMPFSFYGPITNNFLYYKGIKPTRWTAAAGAMTLTVLSWIGILLLMRFAVDPTHDIQWNMLAVYASIAGMLFGSGVFGAMMGMKMVPKDSRNEP